MSFTRKSIADHLDSYDDEIAELQAGKRDTLNDYRHQLAAAGMTKQQIKSEIEALKIAMRRRRAIAKTSETEVEEADALADEIFAEITARAPRATRAREIIEEFDPETGKPTTMKMTLGKTEVQTNAPGRPSTNAEASPEAGPQAEASQSQGTGAGTLAGHEGRSEGEAASARLPTISPSAAPLTAEPEAVSPVPPAASGTISPSSGIQGVTGGNPSEPSPDAGAENGIARAMAANAQSEQAAHRFDDDVPAFLKQERAERQPNPKCQKPGNCKWDHGQVSCWRCNSAPATRESEVA